MIYKDAYCWSYYLSQGPLQEPLIDYFKDFPSSFVCLPILSTKTGSTRWDLGMAYSKIDVTDYPHAKKLDQCIDKKKELWVF